MDRINLDQLLAESSRADDLLIVQDLDGVCMPLVKDPLTRRMDPGYVKAVRQLDRAFRVLTNGEHEGRRGVNRLVEKALGHPDLAQEEGLYLPGLAGGGVQLQNRYGICHHPGVSEAEMSFLAALPSRLEFLLAQQLSDLLPQLSSSEIQYQVEMAVLDTQVSPTVNLNTIFGLIPEDVDLQQKLQHMLHELLKSMLSKAAEMGLPDSFFLHLAPNLGRDGQIERLKPARIGEVGTTDIQFMLKGAVKEAGLLVLINQYIANRFGKAPLGDDFNVRTAPSTHQGLLELSLEKIPFDQMPLLIGVGDTVSSNFDSKQNAWLRGGSDRGFLTLLQELGKAFDRSNRVVLVDSSGGEIDRPNLSDGTLDGITDPEDPLHIDVLVPGGPADYIEWFKSLSIACSR